MHSTSLTRFLHTIAILFSLGISDCASTDMTSFVDPAYRNIRFKRILVIVSSADIMRRKILETQMVGAFKDANVFAVEGVLFFPPTRDLSDMDKAELLRRSNIDAYLVLNVGETGTTTTYVPPTGTQTTTRGSVSVHGNRADYEEKTTTKIQGGYTIEKPWAEFQITLHDAQTGATAWLASSFTGGNGFATFSTVITSFCNSTVERLITDNIVAPKEVGTYYASARTPRDKQHQLIHQAGCPALHGATIKFSSVAEANTAGYLPCPVCFFPMTGSTVFHTYHLPTCHWTQSRSDIITFDTISQLQDSAYIPCNLCKPPQVN